MENKKEKNKKLLFIIIGVVLVLAIIFIIINRTKTVTCTIHNDQSASNYKIDTTYVIKARRNSVYNIKINEVITSKNNTILKYFEDLYSKKYNGNGYKVDTKSLEGKTTINASIDFKKIKATDFAKDLEVIKDDVKKDKKLSIESAKKLYESLGATCK